MNSIGHQQLYNLQARLTANNSSKIALNSRFIICSFKEHLVDFNIYKGIDLERSKWVYIYIKPKSSNFSFSKNITESSRNQICPKVIHSDQAQIDSFKYSYQIHQKYGPSLQNMFKTVKNQPKGKQLVHLLFQLVKKQKYKIDNTKLICGQLSPNSIIFDPNPRKNELYLFNCFLLKKKNYDKKVLPTKYSSRGVCLGRKISIKDDLESICYILIDIFTQGSFLLHKLAHQCKQSKLSLKIQQFAQGLPQIFIDFYYYTINLNYTDDINFFYWKSYLTKFLTPSIIAHPYNFLIAKKSDFQQKPNKKSIDFQSNQVSDMFQTFEANQDTRQEHILKIQRTFSNNFKLIKQK